MSIENKDEKEKLSWREIDKLKDQSSHISQEKSSPKPSKRSEWVSKQYRKEIERLWMGKKGTDEYKKARNKIYNFHGTSKFNSAVKNFIADYGLPDDWNTLFLMLDYKKTDVVKEILLRLEDLYKTKSLTEIQGFRSKLEIMAMTTTNEELEKTIQSVLEK